MTAAILELGTKRSWRCCHRTSVVRGEAENICSRRVFRLLTHMYGPADTIAVPSVLAAYNWAPNTERRRKLALFVDAFFTKFAALQNPPFHPKWKEVSLPAPLAGWNRLPLAQQWLDKHGVEPVKRRFEAFLQENPAAANIESEADKEALFRQFQAWEAGRNARAQMDSQVGSEKVRDRDHASQSATQAAPPRPPPCRSHPARRALGTLTGQGAATECEHHGYRRDRADPDACNRASEEAWRNPFPGATSPPGATQGISTTDRPSSGFAGR
jgi:hypothetical protein